MPTIDRPERLYEQVAAGIRRQIHERTYRPGDRLPSVRELSRRSRVSVSTVLDAYRLLEDQGLIAPRPQSGYYVRAAMRPPAPERTAPTACIASSGRDDLLITMSQELGREDVVQLGFANPDPDLLPLERLARLAGRVAREHPETTYGYAPVSGHRSLREQIAQRTFAAGAIVSPDEIVVTTGAQEALCLALRAVAPPGALVAVESPCHYGVLQAVYMAGLRGLEIATRPGTGLCVDALEASIEAAERRGDPVRAIVVNPNFQNPLGSLMPDQAKAQLVALSAERGIPLIEDDVYGELGFAGDRPRCLRAFPGGEDVIVCSSFSKTLSPGHRVGWVLTGRRHSELQRLKHAMSVSAPSLPQLLLSELLASGGYDQFLRRARRAYAASESKVAEAVAACFPSEARMTHPQGGFVLWIEVPGCDSVRVFETAVREGILVAPGLLFGANDTYRSFLRLTTSRWNPRIEAGIERLSRIVRA
ncbi:MAG: PLP-dependent aminotransferase family protein [Fimbriimonas sp.]